MTPALENVTLWHERDISHSAVERVMAPDATIPLDFALDRLTGVIDKLLVYPEAMQRNLDPMAGSSFRSACCWRSPRPAWRGRRPIAPSSAMPCGSGRRGRFPDPLKADPEVAGKLPAAELEACFDLAYHTRQVDTIFKRVFGGV